MIQETDAVVIGAGAETKTISDCVRARSQLMLRNRILVMEMLLSPDRFTVEPKSAEFDRNLTAIASLWKAYTALPQDAESRTLAQAFAINAIGPALLMKHFLPLLPRDRRALFATLSAKVGSIGDNRLGGWYAYRASKAALNQLVRTASVELRRSRPQAICVALHPGTVDTGLSAPFAKSGLQVQAPALAAQRLLTVLAGLKAEDSGEFFDYRGERLPW